MGWPAFKSTSRFHNLDSIVTASTARLALASFNFQHLYGTLSAAAMHVGMSPDCHKPGLGVREISSAADTGPDVMASCAGAAAG